MFSTRRAVTQESEDMTTFRIIVNYCSETQGIDECLYLTIKHGYFDLVSQLLGHQSVDLNAPDTSRALGAACHHGHVGLIQRLLQHGVPVDGYFPEGDEVFPSSVPLFIAIYEGNFNIVQMLLANGANSNPICNRGVPGWGDDHPENQSPTSLQLAAERGHLDIVHLLLNNNTETAALELRCKQAAVWAAEEGHHAIARILREYKLQIGEDVL